MDLVGYFVGIGFEDGLSCKIRLDKMPREEIKTIEEAFSCRGSESDGPKEVWCWFEYVSKKESKRIDELHNSFGMIPCCDYLSDYYRKLFGRRTLTG